MRPQLHFTAETGWVNDPHGLTFHNGEYHLFHQYVPDSLVWAPSCHWGHATSTDLLAWVRRGVAIAPGDGDDGIWTGSLVTDADGDARILYTSVKQPDLGLGRIRVATPVDAGWETWTKGDVIVRPPEDLDLIAYRDPFVTRETAGWRMFVGAGTRDGTAMAVTYTSADLLEWEYDGAALTRHTSEVEPVWMGALWECPQVFEVDGHWAMVSSVWDDDVLHYAGYALGGPEAYRAGRFEATAWGQLSFGGSYYAPSFFRDREGRPCLMFWMRGVADAEGGWASCLSLPHLLSVRDGRLVSEPHPEVLTARAGPIGTTDISGAVDIEWMPAPGGDQMVLSAARGKTACLRVDDHAVSLERPGQETWFMPWAGGQLRVVIDGPVIEVSSADGILGGAIDPSTSWLPVSGTCTAWSLG